MKNLNAEKQTSRPRKKRFFKAVLDGDLNVASELLKENKHLAGSVNEAGFTALMMAAMMGHVPLLKRLLPCSNAKKASEQGTALSLAAKRGHLDCVNLLIPHSEADETGGSLYTPLMHAAENGDLEMVRALLPVSDVRRVTRMGQKNALTIALENKHTACAALLLPRSDLNFKNHHGQTLLALAAYHGAIEIVQALLPRLDVTAIDGLGHSALSLAVMKGQTEAVRALLPCHTPERVQSFHGFNRQSLLISAVKMNDLELVDLLLPFSNPHEQDDFGKNAFHYAQKASQEAYDRIKRFELTQTERLQLTKIMAPPSDKHEKNHASLKPRKLQGLRRGI